MSIKWTIIKWNMHMSQQCAVVCMQSLWISCVQYRQCKSSDLLFNVMFIETMKDLWFTNISSSSNDMTMCVGLCIPYSYYYVLHTKTIHSLLVLKMDFDRSFQCSSVVVKGIHNNFNVMVSIEMLGFSQIRTMTYHLSRMFYVVIC